MRSFVPSNKEWTCQYITANENNTKTQEWAAHAIAKPY